MKRKIILMLKTKGKDLSKKVKEYTENISKENEQKNNM